MGRSVTRAPSAAERAAERKRESALLGRMQRFSWDKVPLTTRQDRETAREGLEALSRKVAKAQKDEMGAAEVATLIAAGYLHIEKMAADEMLALINFHLGYGVRKQSFPQMVLVKMMLGHLRPENRLSELATGVKREIERQTRERKKMQEPPQ